MNRTTHVAPFLFQTLFFLTFVCAPIVGRAATTVATPTFSPTAGSYTGTQTVSISDTTSGATIYYTTDGSTPSSSSTKYTAAISVSTSETIKAIAEHSGDTNSAVASAAYTITVPTPTFSPGAGAYTSSQSVTISDATSGATCYYTLTAGTTGTTPTTSSTRYTSAIAVTATSVLEALCAYSGDTNSSVASAAYTITVATPTFSPTAGSYTGTQSVSISDTTSGATIYYTTNGSTPSSSSTQYTTAISVSTSETIKAIAEHSGDTNSAVASAAYTITVPTPTFSPGAGTYTSSQSVTISDAISGATCYYTLTAGTTGTTPTTSSTQYTSAIAVTATSVLEALCAYSGDTNSAVASAAYTIAAPTPTFSPVAGNYASAQTVTISDSNSTATVYYTLTAGTTGTTPTTSSSIYANPIGISSDYTLEAMAVVTGYSNSAVATAVYTIQAATPTFSLAAGSYVGTQTVTISDATSGNARIYYTTNGTTPTTSSTRYTGAITVSSTETIKAIATASGYSTSPVGSAAYTITSAPATPTFSPVAGAYTGAQLVTIGDSSSNATIYYTVTSGTSGSTPTTSSTVYTGAISVGSTETLEAIAAVTGYSSSSVATATYTLPAIANSTTTLTVTSGGNPVTSVASGSAVALTATVVSGAAAVTPGTVNFCDAMATYCTDIHLLGTAQLTSAGKATINLRQGIGSHSYKAIFVGTSSYATSTSSTDQLTVTGSYPTTTMIMGTGGSAGNYTLTAQVIGIGSNTIAPTGTVSILDTSSANALLGSASLSGTGTALTFANVSTATTGNNPEFVVVGDFNGDGKPDLAVVNTFALGNYTHSVTILLNNGDGTFTQASGSPVMVGNVPTSAVVGDFNGDGKLDLAVLNSADNTVTVLMGNGDGTFTVANTSPIAVYNPQYLVVSDFNGDGKLDLAVTNGTDGTLTILLGNGDGTFAEANGSPVSVGGYGYPTFLATGDFNGDGKPDLALIGSSNTVTILLGNGDGTFAVASGSPIALANDIQSIMVGDFNGDGKLDLAAFEYNSVTILLGNGDGTFIAAPNPTAASSWGGQGVVGDFNGDGKLDLAFKSGDSCYTNCFVTVLLGNGDGTFNPLLDIGNTPASDFLYMAGGDFNGDGIPDLAISDGDSNTVTILQTSGGDTATATVTGVAPVGGGTHNVDASYGGDNNFNGSTSATTPLTTVVDAANAVSPSSGPAGTLVTITGMGFGATQGTSSVALGGFTAVTTAWSNTQIQAYIPNGTGPGPQSVVVTVGGLRGGGGATYTVTPWIANVTPSTGFPNSSVTIVGTNFGSYVSGSSSITFNGVSVQTTSWTSSTISLILPNGVTTGPVVVTAYTSSGSPIASNAVMFTAQSGPTITGVSPVSGPVGTSVTISGGNFGTSGTVTFSGVSATPTTWGMDTIIAPVPIGATTGPVVVTAGGIASNSYTFTVSAGITGIAPVQGNVGTTVTINGTGFGSMQGSSSVTFNGVSATPSSWSNTSIVVAVPSGATTGNVAVLVNGVSNVGPVFLLLPFINNLTPSAGPVGTIVTVSGSNFGSIQGISSVAFGQVAAVPTQWSQDMIMASVPQGASTGSVVVAVAGQASNGVPFAVGTTTAAAITGTVTQSDGVTPIAGASVTVSQGTNTIATTVTNASGIYSVSNLGVATYSLQVSAPGFGVGSQSNVSVSAGQATVVNFSLSGQSIINYTYDGLGRLVGVANSAIGAVGYSYDAVGNILSIGNVAAGQVSILGFTPISGPVGASVTISGTSFSGNAQQDTVTLGGAAATVTSATNNQISITVPTGATTGPITVATPSGTATSSASFTIETAASALSITSFTPTMSNVGSTVTISGNGFDSLANDRLEFNGTLAFLTSATSTSISATVPANAESGPISIATPLGNAISSADFFVLPSAYTPGQVDFTGQMSVGGEFTGTIINGGDIGLVLFNATAGQQFNLLVNGSTITNANISVVDPGGATLVNTAIGVGGTILDNISAPTTGTYTILVASNGAAYTGSLTLNLSQNSPSPNSPGSTTTGQVVVNTPGGTAKVLFNGTAGQSASVQLTNYAFSSSCCVNVSILSPNGTTLATTSMASYTLFLNPATLPVTGTYTLLIAPQNGIIGSANVSISLFNEQTIPITPVATGTIGTLITINTPGQDAQLTFSGTAGQLASVQLSNYTFSSCCGVNVSILNPNGTTLTTISMYPWTLFLNPVTLPVTGTYTLVIAPQNGITGSANVALSLFSEQGGTITFGTSVPMTFITPGQDAQLTFSGTAGQLASVQLTNYAFSSCCSVNVSILNPNGTTLVTTSMYPWILFQNPITLPVTGTYTLVIAPQNGITGSANVGLYLFYEQTGTITPGTAAPVTINIPGQDVQLTFSGTTGQLAGVQLTSYTFSSCCGVNVSILNPDGSTLVTTSMYPWTLIQNPVALPANGTYTLVVAPQNGNTGGASVTLTLQ